LLFAALFGFFFLFPLPPIDGLLRSRSSLANGFSIAPGVAGLQARE